MVSYDYITRLDKIDPESIFLSTPICRGQERSSQQGDVAVMGAGEYRCSNRTSQPSVPDYTWYFVLA